MEIRKHLTLQNQKSAGLNFSFSGLKTAILYFVQKQLKENPEFIEAHLNDVCASIQYTIVEILMDKLKLAVKETGINRIAIGGGVSANSGIRAALKQAETQQVGTLLYQLLNTQLTTPQ